MLLNFESQRCLAMGDITTAKVMEWKTDLATASIYHDSIAMKNLALMLSSLLAPLLALI